MKKIVFLLATLSASTLYSMTTDKYGFPQTSRDFIEPVPMEIIRPLYNEFSWVTFTSSTTDLLGIEMYNYTHKKDTLWKSKIICGIGYSEIILLRPETPKNQPNFYTHIRIRKLDGSLDMEFNLPKLNSSHSINLNQMSLT